MIVTSDLLRGNTETIILSLLEQGDSYGYEINNGISKLSEGNYELKEATLYCAFLLLGERREGRQAALLPHHRCRHRSAGKPAKGLDCGSRSAGSHYFERSY